MQQMLISDANIFIDLECCQLTHLIFKLPYRFCTPDILFEYELKATHAHLLNIGLVKLNLLPEFMIYAEQLTKKYEKNSIFDSMALSLAKQEKCPLLTGDKALRTAAKEEEIPTMGTIWILEQLVITQKISKHDAFFALDLMKDAGRRLPFDKAKKHIRDL